jgi:hypothetical protein
MVSRLLLAASTVNNNTHCAGGGVVFCHWAGRGACTCGARYCIVDVSSAQSDVHAAAGYAPPNTLIHPVNALYEISIQFNLYLHGLIVKLSV